MPHRPGQRRAEPLEPFQPAVRVLGAVRRNERVGPAVDERLNGGLQDRQGRRRGGRKDAGLHDLAAAVAQVHAREKLAKISGILLAHPGLTLEIDGYTDSVGSDEFNQTLSEQRAGSVRDFLAQQGVPATSITAKGFGMAQPVASNDTPEGRQQNRRVEIVVNGDSIGTSSAMATQTNQ